MDWFPLLNSLRVAALATAPAFLLGTAAACGRARMQRASGTALDFALTLPLVLPPTALGCLLLLALGPESPAGLWVLERFSLRLTEQWWLAVLPVALVSLPVMYRMARNAMAHFDETLADAARTLGMSEGRIFRTIRLPFCRKGLLAGALLTFVRALGEFGAAVMVTGSVPGRTATLAAEIYTLRDGVALRWSLASLAVSAAVLPVILALERGEGNNA